MKKSKKAAKKKLLKNILITVLVDRKTCKKIDDYKKRKKMRSRSAVLRLLLSGL